MEQVAGRFGASSGGLGGQRGTAGEPVDFFAVANVEFDEGADGVVPDPEFFEQERDVVFAGADFGEAGGHADQPQKGTEGADTGPGGDVGVGEVHFTAPDAQGELGEAVDIVFHDVFHPGGQDDGQSRTVRAVVEGGKLVLQGMAGPVLFPSDAADVVVGDGGGPHEVGAGVVVVRIFQGAQGFGTDGQKDGFAHAVGEFDAGGVGEVAFDDVGHHVGGAGCRLVGRQGGGQFRVQDGEDGPDAVAGIGAFDHAVFPGDDGHRRGFAAGGGNSQNGSHGQGGGREGFAVEEVPEVAVIGNAQRDGFGRVDDAAASDGENEVHVFFPAQVDAVGDESASRVGTHAAQGDGGNARSFQRAGDAVDESGFDGGCAAVMDQDFGAAEAADAVADMVFLAPAEKDTGWDCRK